MTLAALLIPLVGGVLAWATPGRARGAVAVLAAVAAFVAALFLPTAAPVDVAWLPAFGAGLRLDPSGASSVLVLAAALAMITTVLTAAVRVRERTGTFLGLLLIMQAMLAGLFLASDLLAFYVFWEAALIPSLVLLGVFGGERRRGAVTKYLIYAVSGSFLMLVSIIAVRVLSGAESFAFHELAPAARELDAVTQGWLFAGFSAAFVVKLPLFPLHSWLIDFHRENHPSGAADVAGTLYKVGGFGFFAWAIPLLPDGALVLQPYLLTAAAVTALWGALAATRQEDLKSLLAYASLSHMGLIGVGLFSLTEIGLAGAMLLLAAQMLSTGGMFLLSGMMHARRGSFALDRFGGLARSAPALAAVSLFVIFAAIGVPGLSNFPGEFLALLGAAQASVFLAAVALASVIAAGVYGVNLYQRLYQGRQVEGTHDLRAVEVAILAPIVAGVLWFGLAPANAADRIDDGARVAVHGPDRPVPAEGGAASEPPLATAGGER